MASAAPIYRQPSLDAVEEIACLRAHVLGRHAVDALQLPPATRGPLAHEGGRALRTPNRKAGLFAIGYRRPRRGASSGGRKASGGEPLSRIPSETQALRDPVHEPALPGGPAPDPGGSV